jgi:hypothetical protein
MVSLWRGFARRHHVVELLASGRGGFAGLLKFKAFDGAYKRKLQFEEGGLADFETSVLLDE